jgi:hypothetical protein
MEPPGEHECERAPESLNEEVSEFSERRQSPGGKNPCTSSPRSRGKNRSGFYSNILANVNKKLWSDQSNMPTPEEALRQAEAVLLPLRDSKGPQKGADEDSQEEPALVEVRMGADSTPPKALPVLTDSIGRRFVSITIHRCSRGLGLLPARSGNEEDGEDAFVWVRSPEFTSLAEYLRQFLLFFDSPKWAGLIFDRIDDTMLPRYQCLVLDDYWRDCWILLAQKFPLMCMAYRRNLGGKAAPHLKFGAGLRSAAGE